MRNVRVRKTYGSTWVVIADSDRFGPDAIMFESYRKDDCIGYLKDRGYGYYLASIDDDDSIIGRSCSMKGMKIFRMKNGWGVTDGTVTSRTGSFGAATMWIWNMAPNHDVGSDFCHKVCGKWGVNVDGWRTVLI